MVRFHSGPPNVNVKNMDGKEIDKYEALELVYEKIYEILEEHNIKLDDLIN